MIHLIQENEGKIGIGTTARNVEEKGEIVISTKKDVITVVQNQEVRSGKFTYCFVSVGFHFLHIYRSRDG